MVESDYCLAFSVCGAIGPKRFISLFNLFGSAQKAWVGSKEEYKSLDIKLKTYDSFDLFRKAFDIENYLLKLKKASVEFIPQKDKRYPKKLLELENPPIGLFCKGNVKLLRDSSHSFVMTMGVVGTRKMTQYGRDVTEMLVADLVKNEACIVSGLALGVDAMAHRVTLENHGLAIAVLACGVDCCLPSENYSLYSSILENNGLIISEYGLGASPQKGTFLARNRIIAALSDGVLVTEAAEDSGSLVTTDWGLKLNKKVFAVPGQINAQMSKGSIGLLKKGGILVQNADDILREFSVSNLQFSKKKQFQNMNLTKEENKIVGLIENEGLTIDEIAKKSGLSISKIFIFISNLELKGIVKNSAGKFLVTLQN